MTATTGRRRGIGYTYPGTITVVRPDSAEPDPLADALVEAAHQRLSVLQFQIDSLNSENIQLREKVDHLSWELDKARAVVAELAPHVGWRRLAKIGALLTAVSLFVWMSVGYVLIAPILAALGLVISFLVGLLARAMERDWNSATNCRPSPTTKSIRIE